MKQLTAMIEKFLGAFLGLLMAIMVLDVTWQVATRFILQEPSSYTEELARFLLVWIGLLGAAYAYRKKAHLGLDILSQKLEGEAKRKLDVFISVVCALFACVIMIYGGAKLMFLTLDLGQMSAALQVKIGYLYSVIPLSGVLIVLFSFDRIVNGDPEPDHVEFYE